MARGGRDSETEQRRMESMETNVYKGGRQGSGPVNFEKAGYTSKKAEKSPKSARKP